ncbi:ABC-type transport auxiliary lipoprotein family protein [Pseudomonadota bacterium]
MKRKSAITSLLLLAATLTACGGVLTSERPVKQTYLLEPASIESTDSEGDPWPALELSVKAVPGLDTDHIQALSTDASLKHYANARWADFLPEVLSSVMRRSLASTGRFEAVSATLAPRGEAWSLSLEVQQFYGIQDYAGSTSSVAVTFEGILKCREQVRQLQLSFSRPVREERLSVVVKAHQQALDDATKQLVSELSEFCQ